MRIGLQRRLQRDLPLETPHPSQTRGQSRLPASPPVRLAEAQTQTGNRREFKSVRMLRRSRPRIRQIKEPYNPRRPVETIERRPSRRRSTIRSLHCPVESPPIIRRPSLPRVPRSVLRARSNRLRQSPRRLGRQSRPELKPLVRLSRRLHHLARVRARRSRFLKSHPRRNPRLVFRPRWSFRRNARIVNPRLSLHRCRQADRNRLQRLWSCNSRRQ